MFGSALFSSMGVRCKALKKVWVIVPWTTENLCKFICLILSIGKQNKGSPFMNFFVIGHCPFARMVWSTFFHVKMGIFLSLVPQNSCHDDFEHLLLTNNQVQIESWFVQETVKKCPKVFLSPCLTEGEGLGGGQKLVGQRTNRRGIFKKKDLPKIDLNRGHAFQTSQELPMLSRSLSDCKSLLLNVMIQSKSLSL